MAGMMTGLLLLLLVGVTVGRVVDLHKRIIGGKECVPTDRLYHVKLVDATKNLLCGGSLISNQWILTAAHCGEVGVPTMKAVLGLHPVGKATQDHDIDLPNSKIYKDDKGVTHDIALVKLLTAVKGVDPVSLPDCSKPPPQKGEEVQIAGYGSIVRNLDGKRGNDEPLTLQCADTKVVGCEVLKNCPSPPNPGYYFSQDNVICLQEYDVDMSPGDSGGGVVFKNKIYGVLSFMGDGAKSCVLPTGITSVCHYIGWIKHITGIV